MTSNPQQTRHVLFRLLLFKLYKYVRTERILYLNRKAQNRVIWHKP